MSSISKSGIEPNKIIRSEHLLRIINALDGTTSNDLIISGTLNVQSSTGSFTGSFSGDASNLYNVPGASVGVLTGSVILSGSLWVSQSITANSGLIGTSSYSDKSTLSITSLNSTSASYALNSTSASRAISASYVLNSTSASYALNSTSASYALNSTSASRAISASWSPSPFPYNGNAVITGSLIISGSSTKIGTNNIIGTNTITGSNNLLGTNNIIGNNIISGNSTIGENVTITGSAVVSGSFTISSGSNFYFGSNKQFNYGAFQSNVTQTGSANIEQPFQIDTIDESDGMTIISGSRITILSNGTYIINFSSQLDTPTAANVYMWLNKNGSNIIDTGTFYKTSNNNSVVTTSNEVRSLVANDYIEVMWQSNQSNTNFPAIPSSGSIPLCPSIIITVSQIK